MNREHLLLEVHHTATGGDYRSWDTGPFEYTNEFIAMPASVVYRPPQLAKKPVMRGAQTAVVVGKSGEEIWTDKYGRVKVQFHWDREGKKDENSSCWVRVSSTWAGKSWGAVHLPRIGQEVLVDFLEGDPDRPIIVGSIYNAEQMPPYTLPANQTQSGIKSHSTKGGETEDANEIRFEDKKDSELFYEHAQKDQQILVENDRAEEVKHDEKILIGNDRTEEVKKNETIKIGENRTEEVEKDEKITIHGGRTEQVDKDEKITISGKRDHETKGDEKLTVGGKQDVSVGSKRAVKVGSDDKLEVGSNLDIKANSNITIKAAGGKIVAEAATGIELKCGASTIKMTPAGIELKAPQIKIQGMAQVEVKAPMVTGKADAMLQLQGTMTQLKGDGLLIVKGGITMIN
jgi:type VI secretion system secreted protein VgrG